MTKARVLLLSIPVFWVSAAARSAEPPYGVWTLATASGCPMTFELGSDGKLKRTTGSLEYTTAAKLIPEGDGWLLEEQLQGHNGQLSCKGLAGEEVVKHLKSKAYAERRGKELYYRTTKDSQRTLIFKRAT